MFSLRRIGMIGVSTALLIGGNLTGAGVATAAAAAPLAATVTIADGRAANGTDPLDTVTRGAMAAFLHRADAL